VSENAAIYLSGFAHELGERAPITEVEELSGKPEVLENLHALGLKWYARSTVSSMELARRSMSQTLAESGVAASDVDAVVYATNHFRDEDIWKDPVKRVLHDLGLIHAYPYGVSFSACGNLHSALQVATGLLRTGECRNVLLVTTDRTGELFPESRIYSTNVSICSDGAASCLLSTEVRGACRWRATYQYADSRLIDYAGPERLTDYLRAVSTGLRTSVAGALARVELRAEQVSQLIMNNYNLSVSHMFAASAGVPLSRIFRNNIERFAHAYAADNLINLQDYLTASGRRPGMLLLLGSGPNTWNSTVLEVVDAV
jgi:3-oxoacyl-[acyl-carrier-protein] synthase III